jgi:hypothetical protein
MIYQLCDGRRRCWVPHVTAPTGGLRGWKRDPQNRSTYILRSLTLFIPPLSPRCRSWICINMTLFFSEIIIFQLSTCALLHPLPSSQQLLALQRLSVLLQSELHQVAQVRACSWRSLMNCAHELLQIYFSQPFVKVLCLHLCSAFSSCIAPLATISCASSDINCDCSLIATATA